MGMPRREGMERKDLLKANVKIFSDQGKALDAYAKKSVKVLVVGNPANTNCLIASRSAPSIPSSQFTCLTRLDQNRAQAQIAMRLGVATSAVSNVTIWGNIPLRSTQMSAMELSTSTAKQNPSKKLSTMITGFMGSSSRRFKPEVVQSSRQENCPVPCQLLRRSVIIYATGISVVQMVGLPWVSLLMVNTTAFLNNSCTACLAISHRRENGPFKRDLRSVTSPEKR